MTTKTKNVKLQLLVKGEVVFEYFRTRKQLNLSDVELRLVEDIIGE